MPKDGNLTKEKILDAAEALVLDHGYGATSIDLILEKTGITKGAFFYHFKSKAELAQMLVERYVKRDDELLFSLTEKAEKLSRDPLQQILIFLGLLIEIFDNLEEPPGCVVASFVYQFEEFNVDTKSLVTNGFDEWHRVLDEKFQIALDKYPIKLDVAPSTLVDMLLAVFEGGLIVARMVSDPKIMVKQLTQFKNYVELLFDQI
ncbi:MAG: TetR/AcrR family transcriptional regulator [Gammaproteobacteria bacterium]|jgi:TetR/AcrR family transcriptional regulator, transcriptional repressor for nem operon